MPTADEYAAAPWRFVGSHPLDPAEWAEDRVGIHLGRGRLPLADWVARLAGHDDNHVAQLEQALDGQP
jgi:hypothetical protein